MQEATVANDCTCRRLQVQRVGLQHVAQLQAKNNEYHLDAGGNQLQYDTRQYSTAQHNHQQSIEDTILHTEEHKEYKHQEAKANTTRAMIDTIEGQSSTGTARAQGIGQPLLTMISTLRGKTSTTIAMASNR